MTLSILQRIAGGEADAMRECIDQYGALVWCLARRLSRTPSDAEDATQEIFLQIWRQAERFDKSLGSEKTFIATLARRRLIDRLRRASTEPTMNCVDELLDSLACSEPTNRSESCLEIEQARLALAELRPEHRQVLEMGLLRGFTHSEIANRLDLPLGTVKSFMRRGLMRVREHLTVQMTPTAAREVSCSRPSLLVGLPVDPDRLDCVGAVGGRRSGLAVEEQGVARFEFQPRNPLRLTVEVIAGIMIAGIEYDSVRSATPCNA